MAKTGLYLFALVLAFVPDALRAQEISTKNGLTTVSYETEQGSISVNYPQTLVTGDRFTGTVVAEPKGGSEEEITAFSESISGYVLEVNDSLQASPGEVSFQWVMPAALSALKLVLRDRDGNVVYAVDAPVQSSVENLSGPALDPEQFELPSIGQVGRPVRVVGPFDGDNGSTLIAVGESPAEILAESPRAAFFRASPEQIGLRPITLTENESTVQGEFRVIGFTYDLPKANLVRGEQTTLTTTVHGLENLDRPVNLRLVNHTPEIVGMPQGEMEIITIAPENVGPEGSFSFARTITGRQQGDFSLTLNLLDAEEKNPCEELGDAIDSAVEKARNKELESDALEDEALELEDFAGKIEEHPPSRWKELADYFGKPIGDETKTEKAEREETVEELARLVSKLEELNCGESLRERKRAAKRLRQEAEDLNDKRDRLRSEAEKLREQAERLREKHRECLEKQSA